MRKVTTAVRRLAGACPDGAPTSSRGPRGARRARRAAVLLAALAIAGSAAPATAQQPSRPAPAKPGTRTSPARKPATRRPAADTGARRATADTGAAGGVTVSGVVSDSVTGEPLGSAVVQLLLNGDPAKAQSAQADSNGRFTFRSVQPGNYVAGFMHPAVDALGIEPPLKSIVVAPGAAATVELSTPSPTHLFAALCPSAASNLGALAGVVRDADRGTPIGGAKVVVTWNEVGVGARGIETVKRRIPVNARPDGTYLLCGLSTDVDVVASAEAPGRTTGLIEVRVDTGSLARRDFALGDSASARVVVVAADSSPTVAGATAPRNADAASARPQKVLRGSARLSGVVRGRDDAPVGNATVLVWGTGVTGRTRPDGSFTLNGLPAGTYSVEARAIGYSPGRAPVDLASNVTRVASVKLNDPPTTLSPVVVMSKRNTAQDRNLSDFERRKRAGGFGRFITAEDIAKTGGQYITDALRMTPGLQISPNGSGFGYTVTARGGCVPTIYVDGTPVMGGADDLDNFVRPNDVVGIEVYNSSAGMPATFQGSCAIGIWTKR